MLHYVMCLVTLRPRFSKICGGSSLTAVSVTARGVLEQLVLYTLCVMCGLRLLSFCNSSRPSVGDGELTQPGNLLLLYPSQSPTCYCLTADMTLVITALNTNCSSTVTCTTAGNHKMQQKNTAGASIIKALDIKPKIDFSWNE